jgi:hypothetical protein
MGCCSNFLTRPRLPLALSAHQSPRGVVCTPPTSDKLCGRCTPSVGHRSNDRRGLGAFGVIGVGSIIAFMIGAIMMFPPGAPGFELSPVVIAGVVVVTASFFMLVLSMLFRSRKRLVITGREALLGAEGDAVAWQGWTGSDQGGDLARSRRQAAATRNPRQGYRPQRSRPRAIGLTLGSRTREEMSCLPQLSPLS